MNNDSSKDVTALINDQYVKVQKEHNPIAKSIERIYQKRKLQIPEVLKSNIYFEDASKPSTATNFPTASSASFIKSVSTETSANKKKIIESDIKKETTSSLLSKSSKAFSTKKQPNKGDFRFSVFENPTTFYIKKT